MPNGRKPLVGALTGLTGLTLVTVTALAVGLAPGTAQAAPDIDDVKVRVDRLYRDAEIAQERYNSARLELGELRRGLGSLKADQRRQDQRLGVVQDQVRDSVIRQYQGESLSAAGQVFVSQEPRAFLDRLATMTSYSELQSQLFTAYSREATALDIRRDATERRLADIARVEQQLGQEKSVVEDDLAKAKDLLAELEAKERERLESPPVSRSASATPPEVQATGNAGAAISYAMAQVGDAYVYGAAGPDAFDCSGLTMMAWAQGGVSLPHSSSAQFSSGPRVAASALQPGDLVFYYSPISHVGLYIGNGQIVHAPNPSTGVRVAALYSMPFAGAVRPG